MTGMCRKHAMKAKVAGDPVYAEKLRERARRNARLHPLGPVDDRAERCRRAKIAGLASGRKRLDHVPPEVREEYMALAGKDCLSAAERLALVLDLAEAKRRRAALA